MADVEMIDSAIPEAATTATTGTLPLEPATSTFTTPKSAKAKKEELYTLRQKLERRVTVIEEGHTVMLKLPSDAIRAVTVQKQGLVPMPSDSEKPIFNFSNTWLRNLNMGKFGTFSSSELIGKPYDVTYEIVNIQADTSFLSRMGTPADSVDEESMNETPVVKGKGKDKSKGKGKGKERAVDLSHIKLVPMPHARMEELGRPSVPSCHILILSLIHLSIHLFVLTEETDANNELIDDNPELATAQQNSILTPEEIADLRQAGHSAADIIQMQIDRHDRFDLKTEFSKDKYRKRKEKKCVS